MAESEEKLKTSTATEDATQVKLPKDQSPAVASIPRESLISTAVNFLKNPKVKSSPMSLKQTFLQKKGLTPEEIEIAVSRAESTVATPSHYPIETHPVKQQIPIYPPINYYPVSRFTTIGNFCSTVVVFGTAIWGLYQLWKRYIRPFLFGVLNDDDRLSKLEGKVASMELILNNTMLQLQKTLEDLQATLQHINQKQDLIFSNISDKTANRNFDDFKNDLASIKGLLLNRRQFPPNPVVTSPVIPAIPAWQLSNGGNEPTEAGVTTPEDGKQTKETPFEINGNSNSTQDDVDQKS